MNSKPVYLEVSTDKGGYLYYYVGYEIETSTFSGGREKEIYLIDIQFWRNDSRGWNEYTKEMTLIQTEHIRKKVYLKTEEEKSQDLPPGFFW